MFNFNEDERIVSGEHLFGALSPQGPEKFPGETDNGYRALRGFDDNGDDAITPADGVWRLLAVWKDPNHNGVSDPGEVVQLTNAGIEAISLKYTENRKKDRHGNEFRYRSDVTLVGGKKTLSWDVFLIGK